MAWEMKRVRGWTFLTCFKRSLKMQRPEQWGQGVSRNYQGTQRGGHSKKGFTLKPLRNKSPSSPRKMFFLNKKRRRKRKEKTKQNPNPTKQKFNKTKPNQKKGNEDFPGKNKTFLLFRSSLAMAGLVVTSYISLHYYHYSPLLLLPFVSLSHFHPPPSKSTSLSSLLFYLCILYLQVTIPRFRWSFSWFPHCGLIRSPIF